MRNKNKELLEKAAEKSPAKRKGNKGRDGTMQRGADVLSGDGEKTNMTLIGSDKQTMLNYGSDKEGKEGTFDKANVRHSHALSKASDS